MFFFLYLLPSASWKENDLSWYIFVIRQTVEHQTPAFTLPFSWRLHITITYNLPCLRLWYVDVVTVIAYTPKVVCLTFQTSRHEKDGTWSELTWFETSVLEPNWIGILKPALKRQVVNKMSSGSVKIVCFSKSLLKIDNVRGWYMLIYYTAIILTLKRGKQVIL